MKKDEEQRAIISLAGYELVPVYSNIMGQLSTEVSLASVPVGYLLNPKRRINNA